MKKGLTMLLTIILLTGCTVQNKDFNSSENGLETEKDKLYYAYGEYNTIEELIDDSKENYLDVINQKESKVIVKLEGEQLSVCIHKQNTNLECFKYNNYTEEREHLKKIFSSGYCNSSETIITCSDVWFTCYLDSSGLVNCWNGLNGDSCRIENGIVTCVDDMLNQGQN